MLTQNQTCWLEIFDGNQPMGEELLFLSKNDKILTGQLGFWKELFYFPDPYLWIGLGHLKDEAMKSMWYAEVRRAKTSCQSPDFEPSGHSQMTSLASHFNMTPHQLYPGTFFGLFCLYLFCCLFMKFFIREFLNLPAVLIFNLVLQIVRI